MSPPASIAQAILDTVLARLAPLFLLATAGDMIAAREAAHQMLAAYKAETADELSLAAEIISLQFHSLEALAHAADPDLSLNTILRLRGCAVSLSRESHKARRKLDQLQRDRHATPPAQPAETAQPSTRLDTETALDLVATAQEAIRTAQKTGGRNWSQSLQKRMTATRMAEKVKKQQAEHAARIARQQAATTSPQPAA